MTGNGNGQSARRSVSIVIPCYRQASFLPEAIESALAQTERPWEIVVVDDGSPDDTEAVARRYPGVTYVRQENRGLSAARNTGIRVSSGTYLVFLDADDRLLPHHLERSLQACEAYPDAGCIVGDYRWFGAPDTWHVHDCTPDPDHYGALLRNNFIGPPHVALFRRDLVQQLGGFHEHLRACEDRDLYIRLARDHALHCHHEVVAEYRRHGLQMSRNWEAMLKYGLIVLRSQRGYVSRHPEYREAYRQGIETLQQLWGEPIASTMVRSVRDGAWLPAARALWILSRMYPAGLLRLFQRKVTAVLHGEKRAAS